MITDNQRILANIMVNEYNKEWNPEIFHRLLIMGFPSFVDGIDSRTRLQIVGDVIIEENNPLGDKYRKYKEHMSKQQVPRRKPKMEFQELFDYLDFMKDFHIACKSTHTAKKVEEIKNILYDYIQSDLWEK
jgi:hypothetical protein